MYKYKIDKTYDKIQLEINIETVPINDKGVGEVLSINLESYYKLNRAKNRITDINSNQWDEVKKITNPYEFIHTFLIALLKKLIFCILYISPVPSSPFKIRTSGLLNRNLLLLCQPNTFIFL